MRTLDELREAKRLDVVGTRVTAAGLARFREARPDCQVIR